eukprot:m.248838 g.248838  ORF g.248838 m.248838 type:complete len:486 (+) comp16137_c1_seq3:133-1590(+)
MNLVGVVLVSLAVANESPSDQVTTRRWGQNAMRVTVTPKGTIPPATDVYLKPPTPYNSKSNIEVQTSGGKFDIIRASDSEKLLSLSSMNSNGAELDVSPSIGRFFGGGCKCGGGYSPIHTNEKGPGAMLNTGDPSFGKHGVKFGVPFGHAYPSPTPGGLGSQCGMMNGMPWIIAISDGQGASFGIFFNNPGWVYGDADPQNGTISVTYTHVNYLDFVIITYAADDSPNNRMNTIASAYADTLGHSPRVPLEVTGYWHSKDSIMSQEEALLTVSGFTERGLHVDVLVLDLGYKECDGCTSFNKRFPDPEGMVSQLKKNGTHVMAHVNVEQNFSMILNGKEFLKQGLITMQHYENGTRILCRSLFNNNIYDNTTCRYDPSIPLARELLWESVNATLVKAGIHMFWLDGNEIIGEDPWETPAANISGIDRFILLLQVVELNNDDIKVPAKPSSQQELMMLWGHFSLAIIRKHSMKVSKDLNSQALHSL